MKKVKIGFFDSGVGGLTVLEAFRRICPEVETEYYADSEHCPYGNKSVSEVRSYCEAIARRFINSGCSIVVVACNSATAAAIDFLRETFPGVKFVGMEPAVKVAAQSSKTGIIAVLATRLTLNGGKYNTTKSMLPRGIKVVSAVADEFVVEVENLQGRSLGDLSEDEYKRLKGIVTARVQPLLNAGADRIVLGCTHFPHLKKIIQEVCASRAEVVDCSAQVAKRTKELYDDLIGETENVEV